MITTNLLYREEPPNRPITFERQPAPPPPRKPRVKVVRNIWHEGLSVDVTNVTLKAVDVETGKIIREEVYSTRQYSPTSFIRVKTLYFADDLRADGYEVEQA